MHHTPLVHHKHLSCYWCYFSQTSLTSMKTWKSIMDSTVTALAAFIAIFKEVVTNSLTAQRHFPADTSQMQFHTCLLWIHSYRPELEECRGGCDDRLWGTALQRYCTTAALFLCKEHLICSPSMQKQLKGADKSSLTQPLAAALLINKDVEVKQGTDL